MISRKRVNMPEATKKETAELNEKNFDAEVLQSNKPVLVDFWAEWCGPCKMLAPVIDEIATEYEDRVKVAKVNVDESPVLTERFEIRSIPTLLYFSNGEVRDRTLGAASKRSIAAKIEAIAIAA